MAKKWVICAQCKYISDCGIGQARNNSIETEPLMSSETGCYNYDQYFNLFYSSQLRLFKNNKEVKRA